MKNILTLKELNAFESSIKSKIEQIIKAGEKYNDLNGTAYSPAYIYGFQAVGYPGFYLELEGEEFWKEFLGNCVYPHCWDTSYGERDFTIDILKKSVGFDDMMNLMEFHQDKEGFDSMRIKSFIKHFGGED